MTAIRRELRHALRFALCLLLGALIAPLPDLARSILAPTSVPSAQAQFGGCPVSGTWSGGPLAQDTWRFKETAGGAVSATSAPSGGTLPGDAFIGTNGVRSGASITMTLLLSGSGLPFTATMSDCDHMTAQLSAFTFELARTSATFCGDGNLDPGEECDDDNFVNGDACTVLCTLPACGNHVLEPGEQCDDGNHVEVDGCSNVCLSNVCGNGTIESGEICDDGNQINGDGCSRVCAPNVCGNGVVESGERCDDGLPPADGDGCSALCQYEGCDMSGTWQASLGGLMYIREDGAHQLDGNLMNGPDAAGALHISSGNRDGSAVSIVLAAGLAFGGQMTSCNDVELTGIGQPFSLTLTRLSASYCGDGVEDAGEQCDDGNFGNGDLCTAACSDAACGNRIAEPGEQCDDGNQVQADGCSNGCEVNHCGDGSNPPEPGEECDDGNAINGDGCSKTCQINVCGNGIIDPGEQCDDGDQPPAGGDGCSALCQYEGCPVSGVWWIAPIIGSSSVMQLDEAPNGSITGLYSSADQPMTGSRVGSAVTLSFLGGAALATLAQSDCAHLDGTVLVGGSAQFGFNAERLSSGSCGDGVRSGGEQCDDGNDLDGDDCSFACRLPHCGNGALDPYEQCDDGNGNPNDACTQACTANVCGDGVLAVGVEQCDDGNAVDSDACKSDCTLNVCGDGALLASGEACDDGNTDPSDGCDETCNVEELAVAALPASGGTVSTDPENDGATPGDPIETAITVPATGSSSVVSIAETTATEPTTGYQTLGKQVNITAPDATAQAPLRFVFMLDSSTIPVGQDASTIVVFRNGTPVPECPGATQAVPYDPCVTAREQLVDGDVRITVLTSRASAWNLAARRPLPSPAAASCRKEIRTRVSTLYKKHVGLLARCEDLVRKGALSGPCPDPETLAKISSAQAAVDPGKLSVKCPEAGIASLGLTGGCASATTTQALAACIVNEVQDAARASVAAEFAASVALPDKTVRACQAAIATEAGKKFAPKRLKIFDACSGKLDVAKLSVCLDAKSQQQLFTAEQKLAAGIAGKCSDPSIAALGAFGGGCSAAGDVASVAACELSSHAGQTDRLRALLP